MNLVDTPFFEWVDEASKKSLVHWSFFLFSKNCVNKNLKAMLGLLLSFLVLVINSLQLRVYINFKKGT